MKYPDIYPGIDLTYYGNQRQLEYDFVVKPGGNPGRIAINVVGADRIRLDANGDLLIATASGELRQHKPIVYQEINGERRQIDSTFVVKTDSQLGFQIAAYDRAKALVIDPVLSYSTFLGGSGSDSGLGIAVDLLHNAYVAGTTASLDFPTKAALQSDNKGLSDSFVSKFSADGAALLYSTYLGGAGIDDGLGVAVDSGGSAYVTGDTDSTDFPTVAAFQSNLSGAGDAFIAKLSANGSALIYSTYLGGSDGFDPAYAIAVDSTGSAYVIGETGSSDFPIVAAVQPCFGGGGLDAFVSKLTANGSALVYSTYLGGNSYDRGFGIAVDSTGNACVTGETGSANFPVAAALQNNLNGGDDAFITKLNAAGTTLTYSTFLGGSGSEQGWGIALDAAGNAYLTGLTSSVDFPTTPGVVQSGFGGDVDAFVTKVSTDGSGLIYSTYIGGSRGQEGFGGIGLDSAGNAYVSGVNFSGLFPTFDAVQVAYGGGISDAYVSKLNQDGTALLYSSYLGGSGDDYGYGVAVDTSGNAYVAGVTSSTDFPTAHAFQISNGGGDDAFITKIGENPLSLHSPSPTASPSAIIASSADNVDALLQLVPDETRLRNQPVVVGGLVADGVTPPLIQFDPNPVPEQDTTYTLSMDVSGGSLTMGTLDDKLLVLQQSGSMFQFVSGNSVTVSTSHPTGFAYISGIKSEELMLDTAQGNKELTVTLKIIKSGDSSPTATIIFRIRRLPIVLVHGIKSDNSTWYNDDGTPKGLLGALEVVFPSDFIMPVEYGVDHSSVVHTSLIPSISSCLSRLCWTAHCVPRWKTRPAYGAKDGRSPAMMWWGIARAAFS